MGSRPGMGAPESPRHSDNYAVAPQVVSVGDLFHPQGWEPGLIQGVYISMLPGMDPPETFGQHPNADVASQITEAHTLFETLLSLQPQITPTRAGDQSREEKVRTDGHLGEGKQ